MESSTRECFLVNVYELLIVGGYIQAAALSMPQGACVWKLVVGVLYDVTGIEVVQ
jgi:hypothetical protein